VYPPNHPRYQELTGRPERCFASLDEASRGGYDLAPPPPGDRVIGGVYLEPAGLPLETRCRAAAVKLGLAVPCPTLIPSSATQQLNFGHGTFVIEVDFSGPPGYVGIEGSPGNHLFVQAYAHARRFFRDPCLNPANSTPGPVVHGATTGFIDCPEGSSMNSGHAVLVWQRSDVLYAVSVHGHTAVNRRIDLAIARGLRLLRPGKA
jgi:hypothetical protein